MEYQTRLFKEILKERSEIKIHSRLFEEVLAKNHKDGLSIFLSDIEELFSQITSAAMKCFKIHLAEASDAEVDLNKSVSKFLSKFNEILVNNKSLIDELERIRTERLQNPFYGVVNERANNYIDALNHHIDLMKIYKIELNDSINDVINLMNSIIDVANIKIDEAETIEPTPELDHLKKIT
jgi:hypothetical protein